MTTDPTFTSRVLCRGLPGTFWARSSTLKSNRDVAIGSPRSSVLLPCYFNNRNYGNLNTPKARTPNQVRCLFDTRPEPGSMPRTMTLEEYTSNHRDLLDAIAKATGMSDPVAFVASGLYYPLLRNAVRGGLLPINGVLTRDWVRSGRTYYPCVRFGIRQYTVEGIRFARCIAPFAGQAGSHDFFVVAETDYLKLFRHALKAQRNTEPEGRPPVLPAEQLEILRLN